MNQREISELRRHLTPERTNITRIYGCYVNGEKQIISSFEQSLAVMEKNDTEKYIELMKKALSGKIGRTLNDLEFTSQQVIDGEEHKLLMALRETKLEDPQLREALCRKIIEVLSLKDQSNYLILLAYDVYDVPFRGSDRQTQMDNSDETFRFILCAICPVKSRKAELGYDTGEEQFRLDESVPVVGAPELGFLFPAFDDRHTNIYNALLYCKDTSMMHREPLPMPLRRRWRERAGLMWCSPCISRSGTVWRNINRPRCRSRWSCPPTTWRRSSARAAWKRNGWIPSGKNAANSSERMPAWSPATSSRAGNSRSSHRW